MLEGAEQNCDPMNKTGEAGGVASMPALGMTSLNVSDEHYIASKSKFHTTSHHLQHPTTVANTL